VLVYSIPGGCPIIPMMRTALIVADSSWAVNDVRTSLAVDPWDLVVVSDPRAAADKVMESKPDVVIVDMQVGSMGGMAVIRAIRAEMQNDEVPRIVLLLDRSADRFLAKRALADASVVKPFDASQLREAMDPILVSVTARLSDEEE
jgi:DNA-binding response OmpR family regulator